jgi:hypothetical protein
MSTSGPNRVVSILFAVLLAAISLQSLSLADEPPAKRAIAGDGPAEPKWEQSLTITVGPPQTDMVGADDRAIQAGIEYVARLGGGTVHVLPGTYRLRNSIFLRSGVRLLGKGKETILFKEASRTTKLKANADWYDQEITLEDPAGFQVGDGVWLIAQDVHSKSRTMFARTLVARSGNRFKLDRALRQNFWLKGNATASSIFPLIFAESISDAAIENIVLDGNRKLNAILEGDNGGCIALQDCNRIALRNVVARNFNGDGFSWQICHDVLVENCAAHGHAGCGLHPGSGSQRPIMRGNKVHGNAVGLFICWGVRGALAEKNLIEDNKVGVSIGHRDTDNVIRDNDILRSAKTGVLFRAEDGVGFAPDRNKILKNRIIDSGEVSIDIRGSADGLVIAGNKIVQTSPAASRIGLRIEKTVGTIETRDNDTDGHATPVLDLRK